MKSIVNQVLSQALQSMQEANLVPKDLNPEIKIDRAKDKSHGDFASNLALVLAKPCHQSPRKLAELLVQSLPAHPSLAKVEIAGPGFINFFMKSDAQAEIIANVFEAGDNFGNNSIGAGQRVLVEYVSANPTGPLHVGHGRGAAFGACVANLLMAVGYQVDREYYVNDAGRQMDILAVSVWLRYLELTGVSIIFPANAYRGDYVRDIAQDILNKHGEDLEHSWRMVSDNLPKDEPEGGDKEIYIDALIKRAKDLLGSSGFELCHQFALEYVLSDIKLDLSEFGVEYENWFSEKSLFIEGAIADGIKALKNSGHTYEKEGALWFKSTDFSDDKDRVLVRANGQTTYFASDVAYHWNKYNRGYSRVIDIFGADHHGYIPRVRAAVTALGHDEKDLDVFLVQFAILYRGTERVQMSTRSGSFVTLRELREEVGNDASRFFYVMRKSEQHMDFDLDLAKSQSNDNPVYYVQYAHARICSVLKQLETRGFNFDDALGLDSLDLLSEPQELLLMQLIGRYPEMIEAAANACEPHQVAYYLRDLATGLHSYYNAVTLLCEQDTLRSARLCLLKAVRQVLRNGMRLLGVSSPESM